MNVLFNELPEEPEKTEEELAQIRAQLENRPGCVKDLSLLAFLLFLRPDLDSLKKLLMQYDINKDYTRNVDDNLEG